MSRNFKHSYSKTLFAALTMMLSLSACVKKEEVSAAIVEVGPKWGFIDHTGKFIIKPQFRRVLPFSCGLAAADLSNRWGYIDNTGKFVIERSYEEVKPFSKDFAAVKVFGGKWGLIDKTGAATSAMTFEGIGECGEANKPLEPNTIIYCAYKTAEGNKWGFVDKAGEIKVPAAYDAVGPFSEGLAAVSKLGKWGYVDATGKLIIDLKFDQAKPFKDRVAECYFGSDFVILDTIGTMSMSDALNSRTFFHDDLGLSLKRAKYGFMNKKGKIVIKRRFTYAEDFAEGVALVGVANGRKGYIDTKGLVVIPPVFDDAQSFSEKLAGVKIDSRLVADDGTISASAVEEALKYDPHASTIKATPVAEPEVEKDADGKDIVKDPKDPKDSDAKTGDKVDPKADPEAAPKTDAKADGKAEVKPEAKPETKSEAKSEVKTEVKTDAKKEVKTDSKAPAPAVKTETKPATK